MHTHNTEKHCKLIQEIVLSRKNVSKNNALDNTNTLLEDDIKIKKMYLQLYEWTH